MSLHYVHIFVLILFGHLITECTTLIVLSASGSSTTNKIMLAESVIYEVNFTMTGTIATGTTVGVLLSDKFSIPAGHLSDCYATTSNLVQPTLISGCSVYYFPASKVYQIKMEGIYTVSTSYTFLRLRFTINNPYSINEYVNITMNDTSEQTVASGINLISGYVPAVMTDCAVLSSSEIAVANSTHTYSFRPTQKLIAGTIIQINLPMWYSSTGSEAGSLTCVGLEGTTDETTLPCSIFNSGGSQTINIASGLATSNRTSSLIRLSISLLKNPVSLQPFGPITISLMYQLTTVQSCTNIYNTITQPSAFQTFNFVNLTNLVINGVATGVRITLAGSSPLSSGTKPQPNYVELMYSSELSVVYSSAVYSQNSTQLTLANVGNTLQISSFTVTMPPSTRKFTFTVTLYLVSSGTAYAMQRGSLTYSCPAGEITSASISIVTSEINILTKYTITFTIKNRLSTTSFIEIVFPPELSISSASTCSPSPCLRKNENNVTFSMSSAVANGYVFNVEITGVKNAGESLTTSNFGIYTYYDSLTDSLVDKLTSSLNVAMTSKEISNANVVLSTYQNSALSSYTLNIVLDHPILAGSYLIVTFPDEVKVSSSTGFSSTSFSTGSCVMLINLNVVNVTSCFSSLMTNLTLSLTFSQITNPHSFKQTSTIKFSIYGPKNTLIQYKNNNLEVQTNVTSLSVLKIVPDYLTVGWIVDYSVEISHLPHFNGEYAIIQFNPDMSLPTSCRLDSGVNGVGGVDCSDDGTKKYKITYKSDTNSSLIKLRFVSVSNYLLTSPISFSLQTFTSDSFSISSSVPFTITYTPSILVATVQSNNEIIVGEISNISLIINNNFTLYSGLQTSLTEVVVLAAGGVGIASSCEVIIGSCISEGGGRYKITGAGLSISNYKIKFVNMSLPSFTGSLPTFSVSYLYNGFNIAEKSTLTEIISYCSAPCKSCLNPTQCLSCLPFPNLEIYSYLTNYSCLDECPQGTYGGAENVCLECADGCLECDNNDTCLACENGKWAYDGDCVDECPDGMFKGTNKCEDCLVGCKSCTSALCSECEVGWFLQNGACVQASGCLSGSYPNTTLKLCELCHAPCLECTSYTDCLSCIAPQVLHEKKCISSCPPLTYNSSLVCENCSSPCGNCTSNSLCLSCIVGFLNGNLCVAGGDCPVRTYPNSTTKVCEACILPCLECTSYTDCLSCIAPQVLHEKKCISSCPPLTYNSSLVCQNCSSPCGNCTSSSRCLSCIVGFLNGNNECVSGINCPVETYPNSTTKVCEACISPCLSCTSYTDCLSCIAPQVLNEKRCISSCPPLTYNSSLVCENCSSPCGNCTSSSRCLSCIVGFLNGNLCVAGGDCPVRTYPNSTTKVCEACILPCLECTSDTICTACPPAYSHLYNQTCFSTCPTQTYPITSACLPCQHPCLTCTSPLICTSCVGIKVYYLQQCLDNCPNGTYNNLGNCSICMTVCSTCSEAGSCTGCLGGRYLFEGACLGGCPNGTYGETTNHSCLSCVPPCLNCLSELVCLSCVPPLVEYLSECITECPTKYFNKSGSCKTCENCLNCMDANTCNQCQIPYYQFGGKCYLNCPSLAPIYDYESFTCSQCDLNCRMCEGISINCTACYSSTYLHQGNCLSDCPIGFIEDPGAGKCQQPLIGSVVYFPFCILFGFLGIIGIASRYFYAETETITCLAALSSLCEFGSWCLLAYVITLDFNLGSSLISISMILSLASIVLSMGIGVSYSIVIFKQYENDKGLSAWKAYNYSCKWGYRIVSVMSGLSFRFFRILYGKMFNRYIFSMYIADGNSFLKATNRLSLVSLIFNTLPMIGMCAYLLYKKQIFDQSFYCIVDTIILGFLASVLISIDSCRGRNMFEGVRNRLPFFKYKNMKNEESMAGDALESRNGEEKEESKIIKSEVDEQERDSIFRKISWLPDKNKFGHLNVLEEEEDDKEETRSMPGVNKVQNTLRLTPPVESKEELLFEEKDEIENMFEMKEEDEVKEDIINEEEYQNDFDNISGEGSKTENIVLDEGEKLGEGNENRSDVIDEEVDDSFDGGVGKGEGKSEIRTTALGLLTNDRKVDDGAIDNKKLQRLENMSKKNGIDSNFMKQTFGTNNNHNTELLDTIINKNNQVKRESVKELFNDKSNPKVLQELFGKDSNMDPDKLKEILNDPEAEQMIKKMVNKDEGIISPNVAKELFSENSPYSKEFTKKILKQDTEIDQEKLKYLLNNDNGANNQESLAALKKVGGDNLENSEILKNMIGTNSSLGAENFSRAVNDLSTQAIKNLFENKTKNSDLITSKILNNKKINLKNLAPIFEDEELIQELAETMGSGNANTEENLINLFKNADTLDSDKFKQMLSDPVIKEKLLTKTVDPSFLSAVLNANSKSDMNILSETLKQMPEELIEHTFKFDPEKNTDFKNLAELFDANAKTDPVLVSKMLEPDMVKKLYGKGNDTKMLNKLVEKGNEFDPEVIKNIYGDDRQNIFNSSPGVEANNEKSYNFPTFAKEKIDEARSHKEYSLGQPKMNKNTSNMRRTAGGSMSFLTPIIPTVNHVNQNKSSTKNIRKNEWSSEEEEEDEDNPIDEQNGQQRENEGDEFSTIDGVRRKKKVRRVVKKKVMDIRNPAEQIYLQRIEAPHEVITRKAMNIRKKKKKTLNTTVMDEDNDVFDMNF